METHFKSHQHLFSKANMVSSRYVTNRLCCVLCPCYPLHKSPELPSFSVILCFSASFMWLREELFLMLVPFTLHSLYYIYVHWSGEFWRLIWENEKICKVESKLRPCFNFRSIGTSNLERHTQHLTLKIQVVQVHTKYIDGIISCWAA